MKPILPYVLMIDGSMMKFGKKAIKPTLFDYGGEVPDLLEFGWKRTRDNFSSTISVTDPS